MLNRIGTRILGKGGTGTQKQKYRFANKKKLVRKEGDRNKVRRECEFAQLWSFLFALSTLARSVRAFDLGMVKMSNCVPSVVSSCALMFWSARRWPDVAFETLV